MNKSASPLENLFKMTFALTTDLLLKSVGKQVKSFEDHHLGEIIEIIRNETDATIEYAILKSDQGDQFYAIPASSRLIKITESGDIILQASRENLQLSNGLALEQCPSPNFRTDPCIFELVEYDAPDVNKLPRL